MTAEEEKEDPEECTDAICEATEGLDAFCDAVSDPEKQVKCINIMGLLKDGELVAKDARKELEEVLGEDAYIEGAGGLKDWITEHVPLVEEKVSKPEEEPITEPEPLPELKVEPVTVEIPAPVPISLELSVPEVPVVEVLPEQEVEELDESVSDTTLEEPQAPTEEPLPLPTEPDQMESLQLQESDLPKENKEAQKNA